MIGRSEIEHEERSCLDGTGAKLHVITSDPNVYMATVMMGAIGSNGGALNTGRVWVELKPRGERQMSVENLEKQVNSLRMTLLTMRKTAVDTNIEHERRNRELERMLREFAVLNFHTARFYPFVAVATLPTFELISSPSAVAWACRLQS